MGLFARRPRPPSHLPLGAPRLDGGGWPDEAAAGRPSFDSQTLLETATRHAFEPEAHAIADALEHPALARVDVRAAPEDLPHLVKLLTTAARIGAGLGRVERGLGPGEPGMVDRRIAAALWQARRQQPPMPGEWSRLAAWFLLAGHRLGLDGPAAVEGVLAGLPGGPAEES